jgi:hypothetical protein
VIVVVADAEDVEQRARLAHENDRPDLVEPEVAARGGRDENRAHDLRGENRDAGSVHGHGAWGMRHGCPGMRHAA